MTGTLSQRQLRGSRGHVGRKPEAKPWPEVHEAHRRHLPMKDGQRSEMTGSPMSSSTADVDATGRWGEGHVSYPRRPACLP